MIGEGHNRDEPSALAAVVDRMVVRVRGLIYQLLGTLQAHFNLTGTASRATIAGTPVIPIVRYRDIPAAIEWLCRAFGMKVHRVVTDSSGAPCFAELTIGSGMVMVLSIEDSVFGKLMVQPDEIGGVETQICYLCVANARAHHARAKAAGAVVVIDPDHESNKGRGYSCRDPEGHVWNFCTYDPWARQTRPAEFRRSWGLRRVQQGLAGLLLFMLAGALTLQLVAQPSARAGTAAIEPPPSRAPLASDKQRPEASEAIAKAIAKDAADRETQAHRVALAAAERTAAETRAQLAEARGALEKAERDATAARVQLDAMQRARQAAERAAAEAREHLAAAHKSAERAREEAAQERAKRIAARRTAKRARRRASVYFVRPRPRESRTWCYNPSVPNPASNSASRLIGFCKT